MKTSTARANDWRCPICSDATSRDESGRGFVRHLSNRDCSFEKGQRDGAVVARRAGVNADVDPPSVVGYKQGQETAVFGRWLTEYLRQSPSHRDYHAFYDHGESSEENVVAIKGFYGDRVSNVNRLADADVMVVSPKEHVCMVIEIEERDCSPKKMLGDILSISMCNHFAVKQSGSQHYFDVDSETGLVIAGTLPSCGYRQKKVYEVIQPRVRQFKGPDDGIRFVNIEMVFCSSIKETIDKLKDMIRRRLPTHTTQADNPSRCR